MSDTIFVIDAQIKIYRLINIMICTQTNISKKMLDINGIVRS